MIYTHRYSNNNILSLIGQSMRGGVVNDPPVNTALPVISQTGSVLSVTTGTWTGTAPITYAYQITRNGTPVGAPSASQNYTIPDGDLNALFGCIVTATNSGGNASAAAALLYVGVMDVLSVQPAANYELRRESRSYTGLNARVRRSSDNAEANFGFATAAQTRTNLAAVPINNNGGATAPGVTMTVMGTGTEFGQPYIDVRWQGTSTSDSNLQFIHEGSSDVTPGLTYTTSIGFRLVSGTAPSGIPVIRSLYYSSRGSGSGGFLSGPGRSLPPLTSILQRGAFIGEAPASAIRIRPSILIAVNNGEVVNATIRYYAANVEQGIGNARPLLQHDVPETVAAIGELDAEALLNFVGNGDGFITILHDKSGNGRNAAQTTAGGQPQIVSNGAIETQNGRATIAQSLGNQSLPISATFAGFTSATGIFVFRQLTGNGGAHDFRAQSGGVSNHSPFSDGNAYDSFFSASRQVFNNYGPASSPSTNTLTIHTARQTGTALQLFKNGTQIDGNKTVSFQAPDGRSLFNPGLIGTTAVSGGVIFGALPIAERQLIERNRGAYYGIPVS
jgi:hypothetical protein